MGVFATLLTSMALVYGILIARSDRAPRDPALKAGLVSGLVLTFALTMVFAGYMSGNGSHFVGGSGTDAGGMPVMGWARDGGDLRVAHFFGTHAMHAVPLVGFLPDGWLEPRVAVLADLGGSRRPGRRSRRRFSCRRWRGWRSCPCSADPTFAADRSSAEESDPREAAVLDLARAACARKPGWAAVRSGRSRSTAFRSISPPRNCATMRAGR